MKRFPLLAGAVPAAIYFLLSSGSTFQIRLIDSLFIGGLLPFVIGSFRWVSSVGLFDLFVYSNKRVWGRHRNAHERSEMTEREQETYERTQGSFHDYLLKKVPSRPSAAYLLSGSLYLASALLLTCIWG